MNPLAMIMRLVRAQIANLQKQFIKYTKLCSKPYASLNKYVKKKMQGFTSAPKSRADYVRLGSYLFAKRFAILFVMLLCMGIFLFTTKLYPWAEGKLWTPTIVFNSYKYHSYTGKAKVVDNTGTLIYHGEMKNGSAEGEGKQYDRHGILYYEGTFSSDAYRGEGTYYENEILRYQGNFENSQFSGTGRLYDDEGNVVFSGLFVEGFQNGLGTEYEQGQRSYQGNFINGYREGEGKEYESQSGQLRYEGSFLLGVYDGFGKHYEDGILLYEGMFANGLYNGTGTLYDKVTGNIRYEGEFKDGFAHGLGSEYDPQTHKLLYLGQFVQGIREGSGELFDILGYSAFLGEFKDNAINFKNYLHLSADDIRGAFYRPSAEDDSVLYYRQHDVAFALVDGVCESVFLTPREELLGISATMTQSDIHAKLGKPQFSYAYPIRNPNALQSLGLFVETGKRYQSDKYLMDNYFIKIIYEAEGDRILAIELGG